jgi:hypothetical protein
MRSGPLRTRSHRLGHAEVEQLGAHVTRVQLRGTLKDDVGRLEITMDDPLFVRRAERLGDLPCDRERSRDRQRSSFEAFGQRRAVDQFQHQRCHAIRFVEPIDRSDVRMVERGEQPRFARKPRAALEIVLEVPRQDLDRNVPTQLTVVRAIHLPHPTRAEHTGNRVRAKLPANHLFRSPHTAGQATTATAGDSRKPADAESNASSDSTSSSKDSSPFTACFRKALRSFGSRPSARW